MVVEVLILISPVKSEDNRLPESDGNAESSDGYIMPVGMFVLLLFHYYVILPYKVKRTSKIRGRNTL